MSRASQRRSQNAASLIRPSMIVKLCADCGAYAIACYDGELNRVANYCAQHAREHGYCPQCGNVLTQAERDDPNNSDGLCGAETNRSKFGLRSRGGWNEDIDDDDDRFYDD